MKRRFAPPVGFRSSGPGRPRSLFARARGFARRVCPGASHGPRRGVSLLEVLISIFVLSVGMLGIAAILPVGGYEMMQGLIADRSRAVGHAGQQAVKAVQVFDALTVDGTQCGMLNPRGWLDHQMTNPTTNVTDVVAEWGFTPSGATGRALRFHESYAIDPLYVANAHALPAVSVANLDLVESFPYTVSATSGIPPIPTSPPPIPTYNANQTMRRITVLQSIPNMAVSPPVVLDARQLAVADRIFRWRDDLLIPKPEDDSERPRQQMLFVDSAGTGHEVFAFPQLPHDNARTVSDPLRIEAAGDYTWMVTVTPAVGRPDALIGSPPNIAAFFIDNRRTYSVSVVVFHNRDFSAPWDLTDSGKPGERTCVAELLGSGWGGGDVLLQVPDPAVAGDPSYVDYLEVKERQWVMLCGRDRRRGVNVFKWYEIVAAAEIETETGNPPMPIPPERLVTLAGPDWDPDWCDDTDNNNDPDDDGDGYNDTQVALFTNVVGVYTTTVEFDER